MHIRTAIVVGILFALTRLTAGGIAQSSEYVTLALEVSPNGQQIAAGTIDGRLILYDAQTNNVSHIFHVPDGIIDLEWSQDGHQVATVSYMGNVNILNTESYDLVVAINLPSSMVFRVNWSPDGQRLAVTSVEGGITVLNAATGNELYSMRPGDLADSVWASSPYLLTAGLTGLTIWNNQATLARILGTQNGVINGNLPSNIAYSSVTDAIAVYGIQAPTVNNITSTVDFVTVLQTYAFPSLQLLNSTDLSLPQQTAVMKMAWSNSGDYIAMSASDGYVRIWDAATLQLIDEVYIGNSVRAFDWLNESELVYALDDGALNVVTVENTTAPTPTSPPTSTLAPTPSLPLVNGLVAELYANPALYWDRQQAAYTSGEAVTLADREGRAQSIATLRMRGG